MIGIADVTKLRFETDFMITKENTDTYRIRTVPMTAKSSLLPLTFHHLVLTLSLEQSLTEYEFKITSLAHKVLAINSSTYLPNEERSC